MNAKTMAAVTSNIGSSGIVNIGESIPAFGSPIAPAELAFIKEGKIVIATVYASNPAIIVEQYAIPVVIPNNFPAPDVKSAIPAVTKPKIINGITNCKNEANKPLIVTKISITPLGA